MKARVWRWLWRGSLGLGVLLALLLAALLYTEAGLGWALRTGLAQAGGQLQYGTLRGTLAGGFELDSPRIELPGVRISAVQLRLRLRPWRLLVGELQLESLRLTGARYTLLAQAETAPAPATRPPNLTLPVDVVLRNIELIANELDLGQGEPIPFALAASEIALKQGHLSVEGLALRQGEFAVRTRAAFDTTASWGGELDTEGEWTLPAVLHRAELRVKGDLDALDLRVGLQGGGTLSLDATLDRPLDAPGVSGRLGAEQLDLASFGLDAPVRMIDLDLAFVWANDTLSVEGPIKIDQRALTLKLEQLAFLPQRVRVAALQLASPDTGTLRLQGEWPTDPAAPPGAIELTLTRAWVGDWRQPLDALPLRVDAQGQIRGHSEDWQASLRGNWQQDPLTGTLQLAASGTPTAIHLEPSELGSGTSQLGLSGDYTPGEAPRLTLDLALSALDPALLAPDWPGALSGSARVDVELGTLTRWTLALAELQGALRETPLALSGELSGKAGELQGGALDLRWGKGAAALRVDAPQQLSLQLKAFDLAPLGLQGVVDGSAGIDLAADPIDSARADLQIEQFQLGALGAQRLSLRKEAGWQFQAQASELRQGDQTLAEAQLAGSGTAAAHRLTLSLRSDLGRLQAALAGAWADARWQGELESLRLRPARGADWSLDDTAALTLSDSAYALAPACLSAAAAQLCLRASGQGDALTAGLDIRELPLSELAAWAPPSGWQLSGQINGGGQLSWSGAAGLGGELQLAISDGVLRDAELAAVPLRFDGDLRFDGAARALRAGVNLPGHGSLRAEAVGFDQPEGRWHADLDLSDLSFVDGLSAEVQSMRGGLRGSLSAPIAEPTRVAGLLEAADLAFELPAAGLKAHQGSLALQLEGDGLVRIDGGLRIDPGTLRFEGLIGLGDQDRSEIRVRADNAGLVDLPAVQLAGDTNFLVRKSAEGFSIEGGILLRQGKIDLGRFAPSVPPSEDVVIEDAPPPGPPLPISADLSLAMIQAVDLRGFGIEATLNGGAHLTQTPGKRPRAQGEMVIKGAYNAYGQKLDIERGRLSFAGRADRPSLDILAVKRIERQRVGVQVRGNAGQPLIRLYSDPVLDQSETLSYLVLGRPLATASGADSEQLGEYASALETAGGSLVAGSIGKKLGLAAGVESFGSAIGSALVVGKYLSPRFFIGYGTSLLDATQLVILRYRLTENIELEGISGNEQKASASWRTER
ncbi:MAG: translocation/assembly module TamB domain-containing protein [Lysobacterales bacterium]